MAGLAWCLVKLIVLCILGRYLAAVVPILAASLFLVQRYYLRTSRQVRLLDIESKTPLFKHFTDTMRGVSSIRFYGMEPTFGDKLGFALNQSQKPFYILMLIQQWLTLVLDLIVGALAIVLVALAMLLSTSGISAGSLGVALVLILQFNSLLIQTIQSWTKLETSIGAVSRVQKFVQQTPSESGGAPIPSVDWPCEGTVEFENVVAAYT